MVRRVGKPQERGSDSSVVVGGSDTCWRGEYKGKRRFGVSFSKEFKKDSKGDSGREVAAEKGRGGENIGDNLATKSINNPTVGFEFYFSIVFVGVVVG